MKKYSEALSILIESGSRRRLRTETVALEMAVSRVVAEEVKSREALPSFDNSSMDGFAVNSSETIGATKETPASFRVRKCIVAGDLGGDLISRGETIEIMTGARFPSSGADAVVKIEDVIVERDSEGMPVHISVTAPIASGMNVRRRGTDIAAGEVLFRAGEVLRAEQVLALAALGVSELKVQRKPRVAVIATGRELVDYSTPELRDGMIRNSTSPFLKAALPNYGVDLVSLSVIADDAAEFESQLRSALEARVDLVITTGAVSMGIHDFIPQAVQRCSGEARFHRVAIRPGKPLLFSEFGAEGPVLIGVPGNPVSTAVGLRFFIAPYLRALQGLAPETFQRARLERVSAKPEGLKCFFKAKVSVLNDGRRDVSVVGGQASYQVKPLLSSNAWVIFDEAKSEVSADTQVEVAPLIPEGSLA